MDADPDLITIVEGPPPEFKSVDELWTLSLIEAIRPYFVSSCQVRSLNGQVLLERCQRAWRNQRSIRLDFPTVSGLRRQLQIVAARYEKLPEGDMLNLWVRHGADELRDIRPEPDGDEE